MGKELNKERNIVTAANLPEDGQMIKLVNEMMPVLLARRMAARELLVKKDEEKLRIAQDIYNTQQAVLMSILGLRDEPEEQEKFVHRGEIVLTPEQYHELKFLDESGGNKNAYIVSKRGLKYLIIREM